MDEDEGDHHMQGRTAEEWPRPRRQFDLEKHGGHDGEKEEIVDHGNPPAGEKVVQWLKRPVL